MAQLFSAPVQTTFFANIYEGFLSMASPILSWPTFFSAGFQTYLVQVVRHLLFFVYMQGPWCKKILDGEKTVELRQYPLPDDIVGIALNPCLVSA